MMAKFCFIILIILLVSINIDAKKRKKTQNKRNLDPKQYKPNKLTPELWCDACNAIVRETNRLLRGKSSEADVFEVTDDVCNPERYYTYSHPPPEMKEGCDAFIDIWIEEIQKVFIRRDTQDVEILERRLCQEITKACVAVDPKNVKPFDNKIMVDGQPMELSPDGKPVKPDEDL